MPKFRKILQILHFHSEGLSSLSSSSSRHKGGFMAAVAAALTLAATVWWSSPSEAQASA